MRSIGPVWILFPAAILAAPIVAPLVAALVGAALGLLAGRAAFGPRLSTALLLRQAELASLQRDSETSLVWLRRLARRCPRDAELHFERGWHAERVGRAAEALAAFGAAARHGKDDAETAMGAARALRALGRRDEAAAAQARARALDPSITDDEEGPDRPAGGGR